MHALAREFTAAAVGKLTADLAQVLRCARLLNERELWIRANDHCNSVGNLVLHLTGNVRQWILGGVGGEAFVRDRPSEFAQRSPLAHDAIVPPLEQAVSRAVEIIGSLDADGLVTVRRIQGYELTTLAAVFHVVEHFSCHTGQIVHMTKALRNVDLSLYDAQGRRRADPGGSPW